MRLSDVVFPHAADAVAPALPIERFEDETRAVRRAVGRLAAAAEDPAVSAWAVPLVSQLERALASLESRLSKTD